MKEILQKLKGIGIVPVIKINDADKALPLAKALCDGGIPCAEITFRTAAAEEAIRRIVKAYPQMLIGAGTVLNSEQVDKAAAAGAKFIVSPGLNPNTVRYCTKKRIPIIPGCMTPSEIEQAIELGLSTVKFFPAEQAGGLAMIKVLAAPYNTLSFMPTGGINLNNIIDYLSFSKVIACGGSWMAAEQLIDSGSYGEITKLCRQVTGLIHANTL